MSFTNSTNTTLNTMSEGGLVFPPTMPQMSKMARLAGLKRRRAEFDEEINHLETQLDPMAKRIQGLVVGWVVRNRSKKKLKTVDIQEQIAKIEEEKARMMKELEDITAALGEELGEVGGEKATDTPLDKEIGDSKKGESDLKYWKRKYWGDKRGTMKSHVDEYIQKNGGMTAPTGFDLEKSIIGEFIKTTTPSGLWGGSASGTNPRKKAMLEWGYKWVAIPKNVDVNVGTAAKWWSK